MYSVSVLKYNVKLHKSVLLTIASRLCPIMHSMRNYIIALDRHNYLSQRMRMRSNFCY